MAPQIIDLTGSDDELTSVPQSRRVDETLLRQPILPATPFRILPPLHPKSVSIIPPPKRRKINEGNVKILPREPVIGSVPNNAIVIDDDDDESVPSAGPRNVEIQTQSIFPPPTNAIVRRARANRLGTSAPRVSRKGKIQKPSRREGPILINHEFHGKMVSALKHQVFVHIQTALASYMDILGRPTCNDIGSKVAGLLAEEPGFVADLIRNNWKLSEGYERSIAIRAQERVTEYVTKALRAPEENTRDECSSNRNPPAVDTKHNVEPKQERLPQSPDAFKRDVREWGSAKYRWTIVGTPSSSTIKIEANQSEPESVKDLSTSVARPSNDSDIEATDSDNQNGKTRRGKSSIISNLQGRQLRERRSVAYRSRRKYKRKPEGTLPEESVHSTVNNSAQTEDFDTVHKIQAFRIAGLDPAIERPYIKNSDRELIRRGLEVMRSEPIAQVLSARECETLRSVTLHVDLCIEEADFLCKVLSTEFSNKALKYFHNDNRLTSLMRGYSSNLDWFIRRIREALIKPSQDLGARFLRNRDENSIRAILEDASEGHLSLNGHISRITPNTPKPSSRRNNPSLSSLLRQREVFGNSPTRLLKGQRSFNSAVSICFEGTLIRKSEWTDCCGDISTITWIHEDTFVCGAIAHSDFHNMQYNKPGNLLVGNTSMDTLRSVADHRIIRPLVNRNDNIENSLNSMRETQDSWLYTSVVSTAHSNISGYTFTASFDETVKVWKVCEKGSSMQLQGTWKHNGKVNFVVTSEHHGLIATASDVNNDAIRVYNLDTADISNSIYNTYTSDKAYEQTQELQRQNKWAYYPATMQWGRSDSVVDLLLVGFSPRSVTGNDFDIPEDKRNTGELCIWNAKNGNRVPLNSARAQNVFEVIWHPTLPVFLAATSPAGPCEPDVKTQVRMFAQNEVGAFLQIKSLDCTAIDINELTIRPMGFVQSFVTASCTDGSTYVWDTAQGDRPIHVLRHKEPLETQLHDVPREISDSGVKFAAWGKSTARFYTGSSDGIVKAWDVQAPKGKAFVHNVISVSAGISVGAFSKDFSKLIIGDASGKVYFLEVEHEEDLIDARTKEDETSYRNANADLVPFVHTRKRPKLIIPHPEPEPPEKGSTLTQNPQLSGRQLARAFIEGRQLVLHPDRLIGPIQGPNYQETELYRKECHEDEDENKPLLPNIQRIQREEVQKLQIPTNISCLPRVTGSDPGRHNWNIKIELAKSGLDVWSREDLKREGVDLDFEPEYQFDIELTPSSKIFKRVNGHR